MSFLPTAVQVIARKGTGISPHTCGEEKWKASASRTYNSLKQDRASQPPNTYMLEPIRVVVCARNDVWDAPEMGALDQYIPDAGAGWTSGADLGSGRGGKEV